MKLRFYNARILSMEEGKEITMGEVWTEDKRILYAGPSATKQEICRKLQREDIEFDREIDCDGDLLMPGFKNAHTHSGMTALRSYADDLPLNEWLNEQIFPVEAKMTPEDIYELSRLAILEYLTSGVTAVFDMYLTPESIARSFEDMGMRCVQVSALNNFSQSLELMEEMYQKLNQPGSLNSYFLGFHAEYTCSRELLEQVASLAQKYQAPVFTHLAETKAEVEGCKERYGMTPLAFLDSIHMFDYGGGIYHGVHMTEEDLRIMKKRGLCIVTNPASNLKLASGIAPVTEYLKLGIPVAIGTDGPASNNCLDMFREMFLVTGLAKVREMVPFTLIPISCAAPLSSETASIACPALVLFTKRVKPIMMTIQDKMVTIVSPLMVICPPARERLGTLTTEVNALVFAPKISNAIFCRK